MKDATVPAAPGYVDEIDWAALGGAIWRSRRLIAATAIAATAAALAVALLLPREFSATTTLLPADAPSPSLALASGLGAQLGLSAGLLGGLGAAGLGRAEDLVTILKSRTLAERVVSECDLRTALHGWEYKSDLVRELEKMTVINAPNLKDRTISIEVTARQPVLAATIANAYVAQLKRVLDLMGYDSASRNRRFIKSQLDKTKARLRQAEDSLAEFQARNELVSLPDTVSSTLQAVGKLEAQKIASEVGVATTQDAIRQLRSRVQDLQADPNSLLALELRRRELTTRDRALQGAEAPLLRQIGNLPPKAIDLAGLERRVQLESALYLALAQQYEAAVIKEHEDSRDFATLDKAEVPDRPSGPRKLPIVILGFLGGTLLGSTAALARGNRQGCR